MRQRQTFAHYKHEQVYRDVRRREFEGRGWRQGGGGCSVGQCDEGAAGEKRKAGAEHEERKEDQRVAQGLEGPVYPVHAPAPPPPTLGARLYWTPVRSGTSGSNGRHTLKDRCPRRVVSEKPISLIKL